MRLVQFELSDGQRRVGLVDGDQVHLVRQREQWQDLWRGEQLLPA